MLGSAIGGDGAQGTQVCFGLDAHLGQPARRNGTKVPVVGK